jgi:hypothetical protein
MLDFTVAFDDQSTLAIARLSNLGEYLNPEVSKALIDVGYNVTQQMVANTWDVFANPEGTLASSITYALSSPLEMIISVNVDYAKRMEYGFHGTDSLGRTFDEEGKPYAQPALDDNREEIEILMAQAASNAFSALGGSEEVY